MASRFGLVQLGRVSRSYQGRLPRSILVRNQSTQNAAKQSSDASWAIGSLGLLAAGFYWLLSPAVDEIAHAQHKSHGDDAPKGGIAKKAEEGFKDIKEKVEDKVSGKSNKLKNLYEQGKDMKNEALKKGEELKKDLLNKGNEAKSEAFGRGKEVKKEVLEKGKDVVDSAYEQLDKAKKQASDTTQGYKDTIYELSKKPSQAVDSIKEKASDLIQSAEDSLKKPQTPTEKITGQAKDTLNKAVNKAESLIGKDNVESFKDIASDAQSKLSEYQKEVTQLIPSSIDELTNKVSDSLPSKSDVSSRIDEAASSAKAKANEAVEYVKDKVQK